VYKILRSFTIAVALLLMTALVVQAGGWAVITLDELPAEIMTGQALSIGFTVRQHGKTLRDDLQPLIHFAHADTTESFTVTAEREGASGHYSARMTFPSGGQWNWRVDIEKFGMVTQDMPPLIVEAAPTVTSAAKARASTVELLLYFISTIRQALTGRAATTTAPVSLTAANTTRANQVELGKALFEAKGCVMCHTNTAVRAGAGPYYFGDKPAPNLTHVELSDEYLRQWLKNPADLKPGTYMPNLKLRSDEIEALIAFLKSE
jgi:cytochrome c2